MFNILFLNMAVVVVISHDYLVGFQSLRLIVAVISRLNNLQLGLGDIKTKWIVCVLFHYKSGLNSVKMINDVFLKLLNVAKSLTCFVIKPYCCCNDSGEIK